MFLHIRLECFRRKCTSWILLSMCQMFRKMISKVSKLNKNMRIWIRYFLLLKLNKNKRMIFRNRFKKSKCQISNLNVQYHQYFNKWLILIKKHLKNVEKPFFSIKCIIQYFHNPQLKNEWKTIEEVRFRISAHFWNYDKSAVLAIVIFHPETSRYL